MMDVLVPAILAAPGAVALLLLCGGRRLPGADLLATAVMALATALSVAVAVPVLRDGVVWSSPVWSWLPWGDQVLGLHLAVDPLAAVLLVLVTGLTTGAMVVSRWYLHGDAGYHRFWWSFSLFACAMILVVLSGGLLGMFIGWELVGLGSYLLIGHWRERPSAAADPAYQAGKPAWAAGVDEARLSPARAQLKAFVMNRIGDAGFVAGIALIAWVVAGWAQAKGLVGVELLAWGTIADAVRDGAFAQVSLAGLSGMDLLTLAGLLIACGAIGKSAQFPLQGWLADAMQGPTTASAIIHAATMVAAGVFLVARMTPVLTPDALLVVGVVGGLTALAAAAIACVQWDLKAVLAYSTMSQLGLMLVGLGAGPAAGGTAAGLVHLAAHAVFKCLLFLGAAVIIHGCAGAQGLHRIGGLGRRMPVTAAVTAIAVLAIVGMPGFAGFHSKDGVLVAAVVAAQARSAEVGLLAWLPLICASVASALTAYYMGRWWWRLFVAAPGEPEVTTAAHDPPWPTLVVLVVLAAGCVQMLWSGQVAPWAHGGWLEPALEPVPAGLLARGMVIDHGAIAAAQQHVATVAAMTAVAGLVVAWCFWVYLPGRGIDAAGILVRRGPVRWIWRGLSHLLGTEAVSSAVARWCGSGLAGVLAAADLGRRWSWDSLIDRAAGAVAWTGRCAARLHEGRLAVYAAIAVAAIAALLLGVR
jgi:NADH-quinone oxidoreductase subunit L